MNMRQKVFRNWKQIRLWLLALVLPAILIALPAWSQSNEMKQIAADEILNEDVFLRGEQVVLDGTVNGNAFLAGRDIIINGSVSDDLYTAGQTITLAGEVGGDFIVAGRQIYLQGRVASDLIAAGRSIIVDGAVGDDVRMAGQLLQLGEGAQVEDDVVAAGASLAVAPGSTIGGNLNLAMGQAEIAGQIDESLYGGFGSALLSGTVGGDAQLLVGATKPPVVWPAPSEIEGVDVPLGLTLTDSAQIGGNLVYRSSQEADISEAASIDGEVVYQVIPAVEDTAIFTRGWLIGMIQRFLALLIVGLLLLRLLPGWGQALVSKIKTRPFPSLGWGLLAVIIVGVLAVAISFVTLLLTVLLAAIVPGLALPVLGLGSLANLTLTLGFGIFAAFIPQVVVSWWGGDWLLEKFGSEGSRYAALVAGLMLFALVTSIPILGGLINLVVILLGLGALWLWWKGRNPPQSASHLPEAMSS